ncbi:S-layer homology domain-containing protein [Paenibacillus hexagrammi]|uniref:S-layer homology domain-containing protein n=1 Tax=Paenibacillus hexagrammi TaxID=2908839 RepID=A0ABY3SDM7_9BACL|nr:S-layer homology domain-containing protein [Paenibacillus sp. YPD9-1]UJF31922.1 S-layer homology domain-containing protein [Paenibacillus sp. YPD9-1]
MKELSFTNQTNPRNQTSIKKKLLTISVGILVLSTLHTMPIMADDNPTGFADMRDHWAQKAVATAIAKKYVDGYSDGSFRPENYVSTAEFIKMVVTATQLPVSGSTDGSEWYVPYMKAAVEKGIVREDSITSDTLNKPISRVEMAKIVVRATDPALQQKIVSLNDQGAMYMATSKGLIQGLANGELAPDGSTTRAQSVTIIERILSLNSGQKLETDKYAVSNAELALKKTNLFSMIPAFSGLQPSGHEWTPEKLVYETPDQKYKGEVDQVVAVDLEDPNDPNRFMLGDIDKLRVYDGGDYFSKMPYVKDYMNSYVILVKSHEVFNKDTSLYRSGLYGLAMSFTGFKTPNSKNTIVNGKLSTLSFVFKERLGDMAAYIVPKGVDSQLGINIAIKVPAIPPSDDMTHTITHIEPVKK